MDIRQVIQSQYGASLDMLKQAVEKCPVSLWDDRRYRNRFWHIAYHALFYTHLYRQPRRETLLRGPGTGSSTSSWAKCPGRRTTS